MNLIRYWLRKLREHPARVRARKPRIEVLRTAGIDARIDVRCRADAYLVGTADQLEQEQKAVFLKSLRPDDIVYDVGAHMGLWTVFIAQAVPRGCVHAFEPEPTNRAQLTLNIRLNGLDNAEVHGHAIADREGEVEFALFDGLRGSRHSIMSGQEAEHTMRVETLPLDSVPSRLGIPEPTALKIDIEGAEGLALSGASRLLSRPSLRLILIEIHRQAIDAGWTAERIRDDLADNGFELARTWKRAGQVHDFFRRTELS